MKMYLDKETEICTYSVQRLAKLLEISTQAVHKRLKKGTVITFDMRLNIQFFNNTCIVNGVKSVNND